MLFQRNWKAENLKTQQNFIKHQGTSKHHNSFSNYARFKICCQFIWKISSTVRTALQKEKKQQQKGYQLQNLQSKSASHFYVVPLISWLHLYST